MAHEIEAGAADAASAFFRRRPKHVLPLGSPCPNCAAPLAGPWCHACGQSAEDFHRSLWRLMVEALGGFFELDSRFWRTLPNLFVNPARLTRDYLDGHRAPQTPPFRLFLVVVVLTFLAFGVGQTHPKAPAAKTAAAMNLDDPTVSFGRTETEKKIGAWFTARIRAARDHPEAFEATLANWAQRMALLALPMSAVLLGVLFLFRRGVYMFDHLIFSMHSLSFQGLLFSATFLLEKWQSGFGALVLLSPVHLFAHMRGTYGLSVFGTLVRMWLLFVGSMIGLGFLILGLLLIGLYEIGG